MQHKTFKYILFLLVLLLGCGEEQENPASFRLTNVSTGYASGSFISPQINYTIENTGSVRISTLNLSFTFRSGGNDSHISGNDADRHFSSIPVGESRGSFSVSSSSLGYFPDQWPAALRILQSNRSRPPTVEVRARINGGTEFTYDTFDIYIP